MSSGIEFEIQTLLTNVGDPSFVADELLKKWHRDELSEDDLERVSHFLITFGFHAALAENLALKLKDGFKIPWSAVARLIEVTQQQPTRDTIDQILIGSAEQKCLDQLARFPQLENVDPRFKKIREQYLVERKAQYANLKETLLNQAQIARNDRLFEREREILRRLMEIYPDDDDLKERFADFSTRQAKDRLTRNQNWLELEDAYKKDTQITSEQKRMVEELAEKLKKKAKKNPALGYDFAISMHQLGHSEAALEILRLSKDSPAVNWFEIELLIETRHFVEVLSKLDEIEKKYATDSESVPAVIYARARALWGLHQVGLAIDLLERLVEVKPDYRSANSLLHQWKDGVE